MLIENPEQALAEDIAEFTHDPLGFTQYAYPWEQGSLASWQGAKDWQAKIFGCITEHLSNPATRFQPLKIAVASGHGIGKSAIVGMAIHWALSTCEDSKFLATAGTGNQLSTKTAPEVAKWFGLGINAHWFEVMATTIRVKERPKMWFGDFVTWSAEKTEAFQGLHNEGKRILLIFDEASAIDDRIWEVAEGALTDANTEIIWLAFGNPTQNTGRFRECFGRFKHRWKTFQIDSRTVEGTNKEQIEKWIADYGEDSDFVRVRVRGEFPRAGSSQFIASDIVAACRKYRAEGYETLPKILSVDVARFGDDQTVIGCRQGRKSQILGKYRGKDTVWVAEETIRIMQEQNPDATVIDGDGIGAGVVDHIKHRGFGTRLFEFHGGASANDGAAYFNRRAEVWGAMRDWLGANAEIPDDPELDSDLTGIEYGFGPKGQLQLEKKEDMKKRGLSSPDIGDCIAMTFAVNVLPKPKEEPPPMYYPGERSESWMS